MASNSALASVFLELKRRRVNKITLTNTS